MGDFTFRKMSRGSFPEVEYFTADVALEAGDLAILDGDSELEKITDGATAFDIYLVLQDAAANETEVGAIYLDEDMILETTFTGALIAVGEEVAVRVASGVITVEAKGASQPTQFLLTKIVDATAQTVQVRRAPGNIGLT